MDVASPPPPPAAAAASAAAFPTPTDLCLPSQRNKAAHLNPALEERDEDDIQRGNAPLKYIPLCDVYSATSPCLTATGSKKVKAAARRAPRTTPHDQFKPDPISGSSGITHVYTRRRRREGDHAKPSFLDSLILQGMSVKSEELEEEAEEEEEDDDDDDDGAVKSGIKRRRVGPSTRMMKSMDNCSKASSKSDDQPQLSDCLEKSDSDDVKKSVNCNGIVNRCETRKRKSDCLENTFKSSGAAKTKWVWLSYDADPNNFIGLQCKVYWPLDAHWYPGRIVAYNSETGRHHVKYEDGEEEDLLLSNEVIKFHVSFEEVQSLKLTLREKSPEAERIDVDDLLVLAITLDDCHEIEPGDVIWAKLTGHAMWPAIVLDESHVSLRKGLNKMSGEKSILVQFFGTHDFARVRRKQVVRFIKGLLSSFHSKCKKSTFVIGLKEAEMYLSEQRLPPIMLQLRGGTDANVNGSGEHNGIDSCDEFMSQDEIRKKIEDLKSCPLEAGEFHVITLGKIVTDSFNFQNEKFIWPEGYTAVRLFPSITDPNVRTLYKMEVLRDVDSRTRPLFRVTTDSGEEFNGPSPSACWNKIYKIITMAQTRNRDYKADQTFASGSYMFGFAHPKVAKLIKEMPNSQPSLKSSQLPFRKIGGFSPGYRPVQVEWRDLDKCNVCHMDEEYENNLFLQCDKCRMMVHARCYGELEPTGGVLWLCNLCRPGAPEYPICCLCPVQGGAMKPTTDGRWAHLACAIWIPETCLSDIKKMEPIDGLSRINKDRWKLLCSICGVSHGACIQCSNINCRVAFHPLCARAAGFCLEPEDMERQHLVPFDEDEEDQCIQLLSFCPKHRPSSNERLAFDERIEHNTCEHVDYVPPANPSGCARSEPYDFLTRHGRNEPEVPAASSKRLYLENQPYLPRGCSPRMPLWNKITSQEIEFSKYFAEIQRLQLSQLDDPSVAILSLADKYNHMRNTFRRRLAFGKSGIHGFGVFAKLPHKAGDMVIEYIGELIRPPVADRREHLIYNSLVGAGTYMFRIDDERVIDATRAGSIAHLINHSCEPNCYSRVISVNGDDHIIIFAKRDITRWEELTYDYRFFSKDERLVCYCGSSRCRGVVNDTETEDRVAKLYVPSSELKDWQGE